MFYDNEKNIIIIIMEKIFERYELLCKDIKHQIDFVGDFYAMDFDHLQQTLDEMKDLQNKIKEHQYKQLN